MFFSPLKIILLPNTVLDIKIKRIIRENTLWDYSISHTLFVKFSSPMLNGIISEFSYLTGQDILYTFSIFRFI